MRKNINPLLDVHKNYKTVRLINPYIYDTEDMDAANFILAASISDVIQISAIKAVVSDFKKFNLWDKLKLAYPLVGGSANSHKFNLKDPRDLNEAGRLTFSGIMTHDSLGIVFGAGYANTNIIGTDFTQGDYHHSFYSLVNNTSSGWDIGIGSSIRMVVKLSNIFYDDNAGSTVGRLFYSNTDSRGHFIGNKPDLSLHEIYKNGILLNSKTGNSGSGMPNASLLINTYASGGNYGNKTCAFVTAGSGLSEIDAANLYNSIQNYQTILSRAV